MRDAVKSYWYHDKMIDALENADWMKVRMSDDDTYEFTTTDTMQVLEELLSCTQ